MGSLGGSRGLIDRGHIEVIVYRGAMYRDRAPWG